MGARRLRCGIEIDGAGIPNILDATVNDVVWREEELPPAPGMEEEMEAVGWPEAIAGVHMPPERVAFYRRVTDHRRNYEGYGVESLADAVRPGRVTFQQEDFRVLACDGTLAGARAVVLAEVQRFLKDNI